MQNPNRNGQLRFSDLLVLLALAGLQNKPLLTLAELPNNTRDVTSKRCEHGPPVREAVRGVEGTEREREGESE